MRDRFGLRVGAVLAGAWTSFAWGGQDGLFHRLVPLPAPAVLAASESQPGGVSNPENLLRPPDPQGLDYHSEYASAGKGVATFADFDFGKPVRIEAFRHLQRVTPDLIAASELVFGDTPDFSRPLGRAVVAHTVFPAGLTVAVFAPVTARYVRWRVTALPPGAPPNVGGKGIAFYTLGAGEEMPSGIAVRGRPVQIVRREGGRLVQDFRLTLDSPYAEPVEAELAVEGEKGRPLKLSFGTRTETFTVEARDTARPLAVALRVGGRAAVSVALDIPPAAKRTLYILPHSHTDIGFTALQTDIEAKQVDNLLRGMAAAQRTAGYPEGARFVWNVEVLWAADLFLQRLPESRRDELLEAVRKGQVALNGLYLNELTGLCRPEELIRLCKDAVRFGERTGVPIRSAMISDVPGYTWGIVPTMAQAGIRYFSVAPNYFDRIGDILVQWENKPFWWIGPDGRSKVLVWIPFWGYALSMRYRDGLSEKVVADLCDGLEARAYPYDIAYVRWAGHGDNAVPDDSICGFVRDWNAAHVWPRLVIASTETAFAAFEKKYGDTLPQVHGEWSPYWEDGAGSSAAETAMNRASSERLRQAETLWAMLAPRRFPAERFDRAWRDVLLYSEHTWGAYCSVSQPDNPFATDQWAIKQAYATSANAASRQLLSDAALCAAAGTEKGDRPKEGALPSVDVYNTASWMRSEVVLVPREWSEFGDAVTDEQGTPVPSQRLAGGELAVWVRALPPFSGRRYRLEKGRPASPSGAAAGIAGTDVTNGCLRVRVDERTGGIVGLSAVGIATNLADGSGGYALNDYLFFLGKDASAARKNGAVRIRVRDAGPLVATLAVESDAPGCHRLVREIRLTAGGEGIELFNRVDKKRLAADNYFAPEGKESLNFAFPFNVPGGQFRMDVPFGVFRPEADQMPSACKNWLTVGSWADVANAAYGVTWVTLDAPLVQLGSLTANLLNSQTDPSVWRKRIEPTQTLFSWAMNNHWGTNYRAYQEGPVSFRFVLRPHGPVSTAEIARFAADRCQPLVAVPGRGPAPDARPVVRVEPSDILATALKPSDDGRALILRLLNASDTPTEAVLTWERSEPRRLRLSDAGERLLDKLDPDAAFPLPPFGVATVRAEYFR